jgi:hypothetical protein
MAYGFLTSVWEALSLVLSHGSGQGKGTGSTILAVESTPILNVLWVQGYIFWHIACTEIHLVGYSLVDDMDSVHYDLEEKESQASLV